MMVMLRNCSTVRPAYNEPNFNKFQLLAKNFHAHDFFLGVF